MSRPFLILQLSDLHVGGNAEGLDAATALASAIDSVQGLPDQPDAVGVTGDLTNGAADVEYRLARELLARLDAPTYVLPGNHDDRAGLRRNFELPGSGDAPIQQAVDLGPLRLVMLDSTRPGEVAGELDGERLAWLETELARASDQLTLLAMHHPPLATGILACDEIGLPAAERRALGAILDRHPQVLRVVAGHMHRMIAAELSGRTVLAAPSTYLQGRLDFTAPELALVREPPGFAIHALLDGELASHIQPVIG